MQPIDQHSGHDPILDDAALRAGYRQPRAQPDAGGHAERDWTPGSE
jgi:hypothetical protein